MALTDRRGLIRSLGALIPGGAVAASIAAPAEAQAPPSPGSTGALDEQRAQEIIAQVKPAVTLVEVETENGMRWGSGFFISGDGLLVTNRHVVARAQKVVCIVRNRDKYPARVVKTDAQYDLALVKVEVPKPVPTVRLGDSDALAEGTLVGVTGYPQPRTMVWLGMALDSSTSRGAVNGIRYGGDVNTFLGDRAIQIDAPVARGNSGGPVFRLDTGEVVGILSSGAGPANLTFAVPVNPLKVLAAGANVTIAPRLAQLKTQEAVVEPGDLRALNTIGVTRELPLLFGYGFRYVEQMQLTATDAVEDWAHSTGRRPPGVTPLVLHGDDLFFGAIDGKLRRWNVTDLGRADEEATVLLDVGEEHIFIYPPVVNDEIICASAGALDLSLKIKQKVDIAGLLSIAFFGFGNVSKTRVVASLEGDGWVYGLNRRNGNIDWQARAGFVGTPVLDGNRVYYGGMGARGCLNATQGTEIWKAERSEESTADWYHTGYAGPLGLFGLVVPVEGKRQKDESIRLFGDGKARVESYDPSNGKVRWKTEIGDVKDSERPLSTAMFVDESKKVIYALASQVVAALDASTGKLQWQYDHAKALKEEQKKKEKEKDKKKGSALATFTSHMVIQDGVIYVGSEDRRLYAFNGADGKVLWYYSTRGDVGQPAYYDGQILVGSGDGYLHVVDARTGQLNWRVATGRSVKSRPLLRAGMVYAATETGQIWTVRAPVS